MAYVCFVCRLDSLRYRSSQVYQPVGVKWQVRRRPSIRRGRAPDAYLLEGPVRRHIGLDSPRARPEVA